VTRIRRLLSALLMTVLMAAALAVLPPLASPASATSTYLCTGYTACKDAGYSHFGYKGASRKMWWRMYSGHNCTNYVAFRLVKRGMSADRPWDGTGMAYNWGRANRSITDQTPMVGAVAWWNANSGGVGSSGHVAYVQKVISNTKIIISEDSWSGDFHWSKLTKSGGGRWPSGFVHFMDEGLKLRTRPAINGPPAVGSPLTVTSGTWSQPATYTYQWYADGKAISGATTSSFTPTPALVGEPLTVRVDATRRGYTDGVSMTEQTADVEKGTMRSTSAPAITGTPQVDEDLTLEPGTWSPAPDRTVIHWYADGVAIPGANGRRLHLDQDTIRQRISVQMTAVLDGYRNAKSQSEETAPVAAGHIDVTTPFTLSGTPRLGHTLTVTPGTVDPNDAVVTYAWLRDGEPIAGATGRTYELRREDVGRRISMQVGLTHVGYRNRTVLLRTDGVVTTVPVLRVEATGKPGRAVVTLRVSAPGVDTVGGKATVRIGQREVTGRVVDGRLKVVLDDVAAGKRTVKVEYAGTDSILAARARTTVQVPK
jgi:surface antigen